METSAREVHDNLNSVIDFQTHHRLRETQVEQSYRYGSWTFDPDPNLCWPDPGEMWTLKDVHDPGHFISKDPDLILLLYLLSKKFWPIWYSKLLYDMGQDFFDVVTLPGY